MRRVRKFEMRLAAGLLAATSVYAQAATTAQTLSRINQSLQAGDADLALSQFSSLPQGGAGIAEAQNLECRIHFTLQKWDTAARECQQAVNLSGQDAVFHLWLGRALGQKASHASFLNAYSLGKQVRVEFETAARLNPHSADALTDLGEFYQQAPGIVGGGVDKAAQVASQLDRVDAARAHQLRARIAEGRGDLGSAEREFRAAITAAVHPALHWTTLASFYRRHKRWNDMESALHSSESAAQHDRQATVAFYDGAGVLIEANRDPGTASRMLEEYLASPGKTEEGPACEAHVRLAKLKRQLGDAAGAQKEIAAALALAHDYKPALDLRH